MRRKYKKILLENSLKLDALKEYIGKLPYDVDIGWLVPMKAKHYIVGNWNGEEFCIECGKYNKMEGRKHGQPERRF